jgi:hypothetical protein
MCNVFEALENDRREAKMGFNESLATGRHFQASFIAALRDAKQEASMRDSSYDRTIKRGYLQRWIFSESQCLCNCKWQPGPAMISTDFQGSPAAA